jgi:hypothetical protein
MHERNIASLNQVKNKIMENEDRKNGTQSVQVVRKEPIIHKTTVIVDKPVN